MKKHFITSFVVSFLGLLLRLSFFLFVSEEGTFMAVGTQMCAKALKR